MSFGRTRGLRVLAISVAALMLATACSADPPNETVESFPDQGRGHLQAGDATPQYNSDPPTSGPHAPVSARCGIHLAEIPDVVQVHGLEHGVVIVHYDASSTQERIDDLENLVDEFDHHLIVAPRVNLETPIVLTAWTKRLALSEFDIEAVRSFYAATAENGPETVTCPAQPPR